MRSWLFVIRFCVIAPGALRAALGIDLAGQSDLADRWSTQLLLLVLQCAACDELSRV